MGALVGIAPRLRAGWSWRLESRYMQGTFLQKRPDRLRPTQPPVWVPEVKQPGYRVNHSFPSSADVNYDWNCICTVFTSKRMFEKQQ